jgi:putative tryptophan/tyrosine transport system substrate-binding protein
MFPLKRREFISLLGGAAAAWPLSTRAQQGERMRRIGVLIHLSEAHPAGQRYVAVFRQGLKELGWTDGGNVRIDVRWIAGDLERLHSYPGELVALAPDVILATYTPGVLAVQRTSRTVPIVFVGVIDAVGSGLVKSLARPGSNATGFLVFEYSIASKWFELLKEIAPRVSRVAVVREAAIAAGIGQFAAIQALAPIGVELSVIDIDDSGAIERDIAAFADGPNGGLIVTPNRFTTNNPDGIAALAARHKLPAVYPFRYFVDAGGLISYGADEADGYRRAPAYVDRILKGAKPADLPVQAPTKYELVINLKTARALGLEIPPTLLARADEVIE